MRDSCKHDYELATLAALAILTAWDGDDRCYDEILCQANERKVLAVAKSEGPEYMKWAGVDLYLKRRARYRKWARDMARFRASRAAQEGKPE
jgi:hypothetical protein